MDIYIYISGIQNIYNFTSRSFMYPAVFLNKNKSPNVHDKGDIFFKLNLLLHILAVLNILI